MGGLSSWVGDVGSIATSVGSSVADVINSTRYGIPYGAAPAQYGYAPVNTSPLMQTSLLGGGVGTILLVGVGVYLLMRRK